MRLLWHFPLGNSRRDKTYKRGSRAEVVRIEPAHSVMPVTVADPMLVLSSIRNQLWFAVSAGCRAEG